MCENQRVDARSVSNSSKPQEPQNSRAYWTFVTIAAVLGLGFTTIVYLEMLAKFGDDSQADLTPAGEPVDSKV